MSWGPELDLSVENASALDGGGSRIPALNPQQLGFDFWWDATTGVTQAAGTVSNWVDRIGSIAAATSVVQPAYVASEAAFKNTPAIYFSNINSGLITSNGANAWAFLHRSDRAHTMFAVLVHPGTTGVFASTVGTAATKTGYRAERSISQLWAAQYYAQAVPGQVAVSPGSAAANVPYWCASRSASAQLSATLGGTSSIALTGTNTLSANNLSIGSNAQTTRISFGGKISQLAFKQSAITDLQLASLAAWAAANYIA